MKKSIPTFLTIFLASLVSAGPVEGVGQLLGGLGEVIILVIGFISNTILDIDAIDEFLFAKILLFTIILLVVYTVIKKNSILGDKAPIHWIVSSSIAILSTKFLPDNLIQAILLQYSALGIALTIFLPWTIFFFFIHQSGTGPFGRRIGWVVFAAAFFAMWMFRDGLGEANWIYGIGIAFIIASLIFDKRIHKYFSFADFRKYKEKNKEKTKRNLMRDLKKLGGDLSDGIIDHKTYTKEAGEIQEAINKL
ncbi:hypothetical protein K8R30_02345 [archaeon]|nr:hypothetical protein [archaeon]